MSSRPPDQQRLLQALLRQDLVAFIEKVFATVSPGQPYRPNWHIEAIAHQLAGVAAGGARRVVITVPPRSLKSICASVALPAWLLGHDPGRRIICASYAQELSIKLANDFRLVVTSAWYRRLFPHTRLDPHKNTETEVVTTARGYRLATSVGGVLTGRGADLIVIDDPMKPQDALSDSKRQAVQHWFDTTLLSRLDDQARGAIVLVMQRLHVEDLAGHVLAKQGWAHLDLPAIAETAAGVPIGRGQVYRRRAGEVLHPDRDSSATLERIRREMGSHAFSAQYQQNPLPLDGELLRWSWFRAYRELPERQAGDLVTQSWDTASKAEEIHDCSACTTWLRRGSDHYLLDVWHGRLDYPNLKRQVVDLARHWRADAVLVEDKGSGTQLIQDLRAEGSVRPIAVLPEGDKQTRFYTQCARIEAGHVLLPAAAPWLDAFRRELLQFPHGRHDDQVDSVSQYLARPQRQTTWRADDLIIGRSPFTEMWEREFGPPRR